MMTTSEKVDAVVEHANKNYVSGWDLVVECYSRKEIEDLLKEHGSVERVIEKLQEAVNDHFEQASNTQF